MGGLGVTAVIWLLLAVSLTASACGYAGSALAQRSRRSNRRPFLVGFFCGSIAGTVLRRRYRRPASRVLRAAARALSTN
jgi:hypothetical protein